MINVYEIEIGMLLSLQSHVKIGKKEVIIINIFGLNKDDIDIFRKLDGFIEDKSHIFIIGGDFNVVLDPKIDKQGGNTHTYRQKVKDILKPFPLNVIFRIQNPSIDLFGAQKYDQV